MRISHLDVSRFIRRHYFLGKAGPTVLNLVRYALRRTRDQCKGRNMVLCLITFIQYENFYDIFKWDTRTLLNIFSIHYLCALKI